MERFDSSASNTNFSKLSKRNFFQWKSQMKKYLLNHGLYGFVNGSEPALAEGASIEDVNYFERLQAETLSILCSNIDKDLKYLVKDATTPEIAWKAVREAFGQSTRSKIVALRGKFVNTKFTPPETMEMFLERLLTTAKELELAGKAVPDDEIAYQMLVQLPKSYDHIVIEMCQLSDESFTPQTVRQALVTEYNRKQHQATSDEIGTVKVSPTKKIPANFQRQFAGQRKGTRSYNFCYDSHQWKNCQNVGKKIKTFQRDFNESTEAFLSTEQISDHTLSNWILEAASNDNFTITEHFSLTFALYRLEKQ